MFLLQPSPHMAKFFRRPGRKIEVLVSQQAAMFFVCVSNALMHSIKILLSDMGWEGIQADRDLHKTQLPPKVSALLCFPHTFSYLSSAAITHHPTPTTNVQDRIKVPSYAHCQAHKEVQEVIHYHIQKTPPSPGAALPLATLALFFPRQRSRQILAFLQVTRENNPAPWDILPAPSSLPSSHCPCVTPNELPKPSADALVNFSRRKGNQIPDLQPLHNF